MTIIVSKIVNGARAKYLVVNDTLKQFMMI